MVMIRITITHNSIMSEGHANYDEPGKDIVCAAVSALMQTLELRGTTVKDKGYMLVHTEEKESLNLISEGLRLIEEAYPEYVEVIE
jgi:uncharacterized protein YsxB (DUF464 family)